MKNKSAGPTEPKAPDEPKVEVPGRLARPRKTKKKTAAVLLVIIILVGLAVFINHRHHKASSSASKAGVVFTVDGKDYNQAEVKSLIAYPTVVDQEPTSTAEQGVYYLLQYKAAAEAIGIKFTNSQLVQFRKSRGTIITKQANYEAYLDLLAYKSQTTQYISDAATYNPDGHYAGYSFVFHFDQSLSYGPAYKSPDYGNKTILARDKAYAQKRANYYHAQLSEHKITPAKALAQILADPKLGYYYQPNNNYSAQFGTSLDSNWERQVFFPPITSFIQKQKKTGLSAIQTGKVAIVPDPTSSSQYADGYYYFVLVTQAQSSFKNPNLALQQSLVNIDKHSKYYGGPHV